MTKKPKDDRQDQIKTTEIDISLERSRVYLRASARNFTDALDTDREIAEAKRLETAALDFACNVARVQQAKREKGGR